ncbi:hypothetical protein [Ancylobacter polymorphus]|jgi:hypothetical protein|uniref:PepSY domain-containing protein n=1 Tax=Ancylobacter polymorphus TaxID=223390 RepID=A0ABU0BHN2_9HYPH|nr:hypothetical protein [Ancylobacter polymorphus]MDQ0304945.1 hypothetical protein [Ancylobacter polymorphus]
MPIAQKDIEAILEALFDQVPTMAVQQITMTPASKGPNMIARVDVADNRYVLWEIEPDGRVRSARVIDLTA